LTAGTRHCANANYEDSGSEKCDSKWEWFKRVAHEIDPPQGQGSG